MKITTLLFTALPSLVAGLLSTSGQPLAARTDAETCRAVGPLTAVTTQPEDQASYLRFSAGNESYVLGWQLSGLFGTFPYLSEVCARFEDAAFKVQETGLDITAVKLPLCNRVNCTIVNDRNNILSQILDYVGNLFLSELSVAVVDTPENWLTLCDSINPNLTAIFFGPTNKVVPTVCEYAGVASPPNPSEGTLNAPADAATVIHSAATLLLAWEIIAFFQQPTQVEYFCQNFINGPYDVTAGVTALDLNATLFSTTICQYLKKPLPSVEEIRSHYFLHGTEIFAETLWSVSNSDLYREFVCKGYKNGDLVNFVQVPSYAYNIASAMNTFDAKIITQCQEAGVDA